MILWVITVGESVQSVYLIPQSLDQFKILIIRFIGWSLSAESGVQFQRKLQSAETDQFFQRLHFNIARPNISFTGISDTILIAIQLIRIIYSRVIVTRVRNTIKITIKVIIVSRANVTGIPYSIGIGVCLVRVWNIRVIVNAVWNTIAVRICLRNSSCSKRQFLPLA